MGNFAHSLRAHATHARAGCRTLPQPRCTQGWDQRQRCNDIQPADSSPTQGLSIQTRRRPISSSLLNPSRALPLVQSPSPATVLLVVLLISVIFFARLDTNAAKRCAQVPHAARRRRRGRRATPPTPEHHVHVPSTHARAGRTRRARGHGARGHGETGERAATPRGTRPAR